MHSNLQGFLDFDQEMLRQAIVCMIADKEEPRSLLAFPTLISNQLYLGA